MHQLVYISTCRGEVSPELLAEILRVSRINNARSAVSGLLVSGGTRFLQVLEGPVREVTGTYERIKNDDRHFACVVLSSRSVSSRAFGDWSMAYHRGMDGGEGCTRDLVYRLTENLEDLGLQAEFRSFADLHQRAA